MVYHALIAAALATVSMTASAATLDLEKDLIRKQLQSFYFHGKAVIKPHLETETAHRFFKELTPRVQAPNLAKLHLPEPMWVKFTGKLSLAEIERILRNSADVVLQFPKRFAEKEIDFNVESKSVIDLANHISATTNLVAYYYADSRLIKLVDEAVNPVVNPYE